MIIYQITNSINDKVYIGQTVGSLEKRWSCHKCDAKTRRKSYPLYNAISKYGIENFSISEIGGANNITELNYQEWLSIYSLNTLWPNGYNMKAGGNGATLGICRTNKEVVNIKTGQTWISAKVCASALGLKIGPLRDRLRGKNVNITPLRYVGSEYVCKKAKTRDYTNQSKKVVNIKTGETWISATEVLSDGVVGMTLTSLCYKLNGIIGNETDLRYLGQEHVFTLPKNKDLRVVNTRTGEVWNSINQCEKDNNFSRNYISNRLSGKTKHNNKTIIFKYLEGKHE